MCEQHRAIGVARERDLSRVKSAAATAPNLDLAGKALLSIQGSVNDVLQDDAAEPVPATTPVTPSKKWNIENFKAKPKPKKPTKVAETPVLKLSEKDKKQEVKPATPEEQKTAELKDKVTQLLRDIKSREQRFRNSKKTREKRRFQGQQILQLKDALGIKEFLQIKSADGMAYSCNLIQSELKRLGIDPSIFPDCLSPRY